MENINEIQFLFQLIVKMAAATETISRICVVSMKTMHPLSEAKCFLECLHYCFNISYLTVL